ncbi:unnamed protein product [Caenorhabditis sp. 36 PRJEB53466]|nr:unnamed protein product [Caenorhabditis sp. 36 PRJEB53466]
MVCAGPGSDKCAPLGVIDQEPATAINGEDGAGEHNEPNCSAPPPERVKLSEQQKMAMKVVEEATFQRLFIYGGPGTGKTFFLHRTLEYLAVKKERRVLCLFRTPAEYEEFECQLDENLSLRIGGNILLHKDVVEKLFKNGKKVDGKWIFTDDVFEPFGIMMICVWDMITRHFVLDKRFMPLFDVLIAENVASWRLHRLKLFMEKPMIVSFKPSDERMRETLECVSGLDFNGPQNQITNFDDAHTFFADFKMKLIELEKSESVNRRKNYVKMAEEYRIAHKLTMSLVTWRADTDPIYVIADEQRQIERIRTCMKERTGLLSIPFSLHRIDAPLFFRSLPPNTCYTVYMLTKETTYHERDFDLLTRESAHFVLARAELTWPED